MVVTAAAADGSPLAGLLPYLPLAIAVLGLVGVYVGAKVIKPASYTETWNENRSLRVDLVKADERADAIQGEMRALRRDFDAYREERRLATEAHDRDRAADRRRLAVLVDGVNTMWGCIEVLKKMIEGAGQVAPDWSEAVRETMQAARDAAQDGL